MSRFRSRFGRLNPSNPSFQLTETTQSVSHRGQQLLSHFKGRRTIPHGFDSFLSRFLRRESSPLMCVGNVVIDLLGPSFLEAGLIALYDACISVFVFRLVISGDLLIYFIYPVKPQKYIQNFERISTLPKAQIENVQSNP